MGELFSRYALKKKRYLKRGIRNSSILDIIFFNHFYTRHASAHSLLSEQKHYSSSSRHASAHSLLSEQKHYSKDKGVIHG